MGYRQDPHIRAWLASRRDPGAQRGEVLAYLNPFPTEEAWRGAPSITRFYDGAKARALDLGFGWEEIWFRQLGISQNRLDAILKARGVRGLIIGSFPEPRAHLRLEWPHYVAVAQGMTLIRPELPRACNNYYETMGTLLRQLAKLGYERPGLFIEENSNDRCRKLWLAGFLVNTQDKSAPQPPPCIPKTSDRRIFEKWLRRHRPDVIVTCDINVRQWLKEMNLCAPQDIGVAAYDCEPLATWRGISGMNHRLEACGAVAVDFVAGRLSRNESGLAPIAETIMTPAVWVEGKTTVTV